MTDPRSVVRGILVYIICLPLAVVVGYQLTGLSSFDRVSYVTLGIVLAVLVFPILLRWHHPLLVASWNTIAVVFFLPGRPQVRLLLAFTSFMITWLMYALDRRLRPLSVPSVTRPLVVLAMVIVATMQLTGGAGFQALGGQSAGAGRYVMLLGAIAGYFALSARPIPLERANLYVALYLLGGITLAIGSLMPYVPQAFQYVFLFFPVDRLAPNTEVVSAGMGQSRPYGLAVACTAALFFVLGRYGVRGIFQTTKPWRVLLLLALGAGVMIGGYRSFLILCLGIMAVQFYLEGLLTLRFLPALLVIMMLALAMLPLTDRLPYQMQRSLAFLPVSIAPEVRADTRASSNWRLEMWKRALDEVPEYLWLGKGYRLDMRDVQLATLRDLTGNRDLGETAQIAGDYHNGPLSVIIPLGIFGAAALIWFWIAAWRLLVHNARHGDPQLKVINSFLLAMFCVRVAMFVVIFGALTNDLIYFVGLAGMSVALNGGRAPVRAPVPEEVPAEPVRPRALRPPLAPVAPFRT